MKYVLTSYNKLKENKHLFYLYINGSFNLLVAKKINKQQTIPSKHSLFSLDNLFHLHISHGSNKTA